MSVSKPILSCWDYVVFAAMLVGTLGIGMIYAIRGRQQESTSHYLTGNRNLNFIAVSVSMVATFYSSVLIIGIPAEAYAFGGICWLYIIGIALGAVVSIIVFIPVFHPLKLTSINEYLHKRYQSHFVGVLGTLSGVVGMILTTAIAYFAPATAIRITTGFPTWASIVVGNVMTIMYTSVGGIKAVIWTDVFQALLMFLGLLTISIQCILEVGGISKVWDICNEWSRLDIFDFSPDPTKRLTFWSLTIGMGFMEMNRFGIQQMAVQRYCSVPTLTKAKLGVLGLVPWTAVMFLLAVLSGITMFAYYTVLGCDPLRSGSVDNPNQLLPYLIMGILNYPGIPGIFLASLTAASLSTASSCLNSSSANLWKDVICVIWPNMSERKNIFVTRLLVVICGAVSTALAFFSMTLGGTLVQMIVTFTSSCAGPTTGLFLLGIFVPFANWIGASAGGFTGFVFAIWMGFGGYSIRRQHNFLPTTVANCSHYGTTTMMPTSLTDSWLLSTTEPETDPLHQFYSVSYLWISCFSTLVSFCVGLLVSLFTGGLRQVKVSPKLYHPWVRAFYNKDSKTETTMDKTLVQKATWNKDCETETGMDKMLENGKEEGFY